MGLAASQSRFLSLTARKSNTEFEGQQINQQRISLSNESSNYYSQLTNITVPTPPSSADYTKTTYTFTDGSESNTITSLIAQKNGYYILNYTTSYETESVVSNGTVVTTRSLDDDGNYTYYVGATALRLMDADATYEDVQNDSYLSSLDEDEVEEILLLEKQYLAMLTEKYGESEWYVRYQLNSSSGAYEPVFYSKSQVENADYSEKTGASLSSVKAYVYGTATETNEVKNATARVEQDSSGRYISIIIYETNEDGSIAVDDDGNQIYTEYSLTTSTETDEDAYNDALNQYEYEQYQYEQSIQEINAKIEVVQTQDKSLELKLKQLDSEESAISTELEAVQKVISKNVDSSFKTFNA